MPDPAPNAELLSALGRLARGLSALFWGLPIALVTCVQTTKGDWLRPLGVLPPLLATGLLFYALNLLGHFQKQERVWLAALDRARFFALINLGLSPFLFWWSKIPANPFYNVILNVLITTGLLFLFALNPLLQRLTAMLPDEALRQETQLFTRLNGLLLLGTLLLLGIYFAVTRINPLLLDSAIDFLTRVTPFRQQALALRLILENAGLWLVLFLVLLPVAMTMALLWKIKEVILTSVFGPEH